MDNKILKQLLTEYEQKRNLAISNAQEQKENLIKANPELSRIEEELSKISIATAKENA